MPRLRQPPISNHVLSGSLSVQSEGRGRSPPPWAQWDTPTPKHFPFLLFLSPFLAITSGFLHLPTEFTSIPLLPPFPSFSLLPHKRYSLSSHVHLFSAFSPLSIYSPESLLKCQKNLSYSSLRLHLIHLTPFLKTDYFRKAFSAT